MDKILITGASKGIGLATVKLFLEKDFEVVGLDLIPSEIINKNYKHYLCDCSDKKSLHDIESVNILFINESSKNRKDDIKNNLYSALNTDERYGVQTSIKLI